MEQPEPKKSDILAQQRTDLAAERTAMAADRSLMAWLRTGLSMISFGFTLYKFLDYVRGDKIRASSMRASPKNIGLFLIGLGTISLLLGMVQHWRTLKRLRHLGVHPVRFPMIVSAVTALIGLFLFISIAGGVEVL